MNTTGLIWALRIFTIAWALVALAFIIPPVARRIRNWARASQGQPFTRLPDPSEHMPVAIDTTTLRSLERETEPGVTISGPDLEALAASHASETDMTIDLMTRARCKVCGRPLIKHASRQLGFGRVCGARVKAAELTARDT